MTRRRVPASQGGHHWWVRNRTIDGLSDWTSDPDEARHYCRRELCRQLEVAIREAS